MSRMQKRYSIGVEKIMGLGKALLNKTFDIAKKTAKGLEKSLNKTEPYKCKICHQWTKYKSDTKKICRECNKKLNQEEY